MNALSSLTLTHAKKGGPRFKKLALSFLPILILLGMATSAVLGASPSFQKNSASIPSTFFGIQRVDAPKLFYDMSPRSLRLDANKVPHIAYGGDHLYYASLSGAAWQVQTVDHADGVGVYASLAFDSSNLPHISYYDARSGALKYAHYNGASWVIEFVDAGASPLQPSALEGANYDGSIAPVASDNSWEWRFTRTLASESSSQVISPSATTAEKGVGLYTSIEIDPFDHASISYYDATNHDLKYAHWNGDAWEIISFDNDNGHNIGQYSSLALDSSGNPYISYYDATDTTLRYAYWTGTRWADRLVDSGGTDDVGRFTSLVLDSKKKAYISYYNATKGNLKYAQQSTSWISQTIDSAGDVGLYTSIDLNDAVTPKPFITYFGKSNGQLKYARMGSGGTWTTYIVPLTGYLGSYTSLAMDGNTLHISYYDSGSGELKFSEGAGTTWTTYNVDEAADVGLYASMAMDPNHRPGIAYFDDTHDDVRYAHWNGTAWDYFIVDFNGTLGLFPSLVYDQAGNPHLSYYDVGKNKVKYAFWNGTAFQVANVATVTSDKFVLTGMGTSLALDSAGKPRIAYYDGGTKHLKVALLATTTWVYKTPDPSGDDNGRYPSLKVDNANNIHISYYDFTTKHLRYAKGAPDGSVWDARNVDTDEEVGLYTSLALDNANNPHIAYFQDYGDRLKYAWFDGAWHTEIVDSNEITGVNPSLAVDDTGRPNISYYNESRRYLMYAVKNDGVWTTQVVDNAGNVGEFSSLAIQANGYPVIAYYDATNGDLKIAFGAFPRLTFLPMLLK